MKTTFLSKITNFQLKENFAEIVVFSSEAKALINSGLLWSLKLEKKKEKAKCDEKIFTLFLINQEIDELLSTIKSEILLRGLFDHPVEVELAVKYNGFAEINASSIDGWILSIDAWINTYEARNLEYRRKIVMYYNKNLDELIV